MSQSLEYERCLEVPASLNELSKIKELIIGNDEVPDDLQKKIYLSVEELFVNICSYAYEGRDEGVIEFALKKSENKILVILTDDGKEYNPLEEVITADEYDFGIGGLGKLIAFSMMDEVDYKYVDGKNQVTICKNSNNH